ncbi:MAG: hypothetical protein J6B39_05160, partial [Lachnospiraceae bacterium]|nr:hypothetical protein [Lachnospiraceae bacterium]
SVSHMMIEPTIIYECWDYLLISIVTATFFSMVSARFANKVNAKVVGYVTGTVLFLLGVVLVFLNYRDKIDMVFFGEVIRLFGIYIAYIVVLALSLIIVRFTTKVPDYIFRKLLHVVAFTSILPLVFCTDSWQAAVVVEIIFLIIVIIALLFFEKYDFYKNIFIEKGKHEVVTSFVMLFGLMTILLAVFWGCFGEEYKYIIVTAIMAWGPGDAAAAIVGKNFGKHKLSGRFIEGTKSVEGSVAMAVTSFICTFVTLIFMSGFAWPVVFAVSLVVAPIASLVELFTNKGLDTVTVPIAVSLLLCVTMLI